jgi:type II secretory pathway pseudopilin PulG
MNREQGYSVVQLLVVILLIGILSMITVTSLGRNPTRRINFNSAINTFLADYNLAKQTAASNNRYVAVEFSSDGKFYTIKMQRVIGDTTQWDNLANKGKVQPMSGDITFFDPASTDSFAINSVGEVFPYPIPSNPSPQTFNLKFQVESVATGADEAGAKYIKEFIIYPYGGIKSVKVHLSE